MSDTLTCTDVRTDADARPELIQTGPARPPVNRSRYVPPRGATAAIVGTVALIAGGAFAVSELDDGPVAPVVGPVLAEPDVSAGSMYSVAERIGAHEAWQAGVTGAGVNVAVIDTGIVDVPALADQVVATVDLSADASDPAKAFVDGHGHGTHMAGVVAGRTPGAVPTIAPDHPEWFMGVAPDAGIVSVKVADHEGDVAAESLLGGLDWVASNAERFDIGVAVLAFDAGVGVPYGDDPVAAAAERAWSADVVVVAASGNRGPDAEGLSSPATDPYVVAVGGVRIDESGTSLPDWTSRGDAVRRPDLAAPGGSIRSLRAPGSDADVDHPGGYVDEQRFLNSGSSPAAAVVAGAAALVRSADPSLTADEVKAALVAGASPLDFDADFTGAGLVDVMAAIDADVNGALQQWVRSSSGTVTNPVDLPYALRRGNSWMGNTWTGNTWTGNTWTGNTWTGNTWTGNTWTGNTWTGNTWTGNTWTGNTWTGNTWTGNTWTGNTWTGNTWTGNAWAGNAWAGNTWT